MIDDPLQRYLASLAPGGPAFRGAEPSGVDSLYQMQDPSTARYAPPVYGLASRPDAVALAKDPLVTWTRPADPFDLAIAKHVSAYVEHPPELVFPLEEAPRPGKPPSFWEGLKHSLSADTLPGMLLRHASLKAEILALPGELEPQENFDPLSDPRIHEAGLSGQLWSFRNSKSANENLLIIWQYEQRRSDAEFASRASGFAGAGMILGGFADPTMFIPLGAGGKAVTRGMWGTLWRGGRVASVNASIALGAEAAKSELDVSYRNGGVLDAIELPAALGFGIGVMQGLLSTRINPTQRPRTRETPDGTIPPPGGRQPGSLGGIDPDEPLGGTTAPMAGRFNAKLNEEVEALVRQRTDLNRQADDAMSRGDTATRDRLVTQADEVGAREKIARDTLERDTAITQKATDSTQEQDGQELPAGKVDSKFTAQIKEVEEAIDIIRKEENVRNDPNFEANRTDDIAKLNTKLADLKTAEASHAALSLEIRPNPDPMTTTEGILGTAPPHPLDGHSGVVRSVSSAASPGIAATILPKLLNDESLQATGVGIEKLPMNPGLRLLQSVSLRARKLVTEMVDLGGLKQVKNAIDKFGYAEPTASPIEASIAREWKTKAIQTLNDVQQAWVNSRTQSQGGASMGSTATGALRLQVQDWWKKDGLLTWAGFDERVAKAMRRGDVDQMNDLHTPEINRAAGIVRKFLNELKAAAEDPNVNLFEKANDKFIAQLKREVNALTARRAPIEEINRAAYRLTEAEKRSGQVAKQTTALSYFTRYWNHQELMQRGDEFIERVADYFKRAVAPDTAGQLRRVYSDEEALDISRAVHKQLTGGNLRSISEEAEDALRQAIDPMSAKMRSLEIPDHEIEDFLESSATLAVRHQLATFAPAIELTRRFGDATMERQIDAIKLEYKIQHDALTKLQDFEGLKKLSGQMTRDIDDVGSLRDRLLNIAGSSKDPHTWDQRTIRLLKHYMVWTTMGLSAFSQLGDLFRPAITEGLDSVNRFGFGTLMSSSRKTIMEMSHAERLLCGDSLEVVMASKAMGASDIGDVFASRSEFERKAGRLTTAFYMVNGMNHATDLTKDWAAVIIQGKMNAAISLWGEEILGKLGTKSPLDNAMKERLRSLSIDGNDAMRIHMELMQHGVDFKTIRMANTEAWKDTTIQALYREAQQRALQRTVITPGAFDRSDWMTTPMGSLIAQFRTFGQSSTIRTLAAGLQDKDRDFWTGASVLVGSGIMLNEIRNQMFYGKSSFDQPYLGILADGVDRSGILGSFMDINKALETASNNRLGLRPFMGAGKTIPSSPDRLANAFFGVAAGKAMTAADTLGRVIQGDNTAKAWQQMRQFVPGQNHPVVDPFFDIVFPKPAPKEKSPSSGVNSPSA